MNHRVKYPLAIAVILAVLGVNAANTQHSEQSGVVLKRTAKSAIQLAANPAANDPAAAAAKDTLVIGRVSHNPKKHYKRLRPLVRYVAGQLTDVGIKRGDVLLAEDNQQMTYYLKKGKVDWISETLFSALVFSEQTGAEIILRRWKKGVPDYFTVFITRKDSGIHSLTDLKGKVIAFNDPGSTTSYFLPRAILKQHGLEMEMLYDPGDRPAADNVGYVFTEGDELNISSWVYRGMTDASAYSNQDWDAPNDTPGVLKKELRVFHESMRIPRALVVIGPHVKPVLRDKIREVLLHIHEDTKAKNALQKYDRTKMFDIISEDLRKQIDEGKRLLEFIREEVSLGL